jgi:hypothetical protein
MLRRGCGRRHETMTGHAETMTAWVGGIAGCMLMRQPLCWSGTNLRDLGYQGELKQRRVCCRNDLVGGVRSDLKPSTGHLGPASRLSMSL